MSANLYSVKRPGPPGVATIETRLAHLAKMHTVQGLASPVSDPEVRELLGALRRTRAQSGGQRRGRALVIEDAGGRRPSEILGLEVGQAAVGECACVGFVGGVSDLAET